MRRTREQRLAGEFVECVAALRFKDTFNPYSETCREHDIDGAPEIRRRNLEAVLTAALQRRVDSLWVGRDLGYRGGRRTGLALTDEKHLVEHARLLSSRPLARSTRGDSVEERTAKVIWDTLGSLGRPVFLWNVFPLHPHVPGKPMTNRPHTASERAVCALLLRWLVEQLRPQSIIAIGSDAFEALDEMGLKATKVRHPSYGGAADFKDGVRAHYG